MPAVKKDGLMFYPRDVDMLRDRKFTKAKIKYGYLSIVVYDALLEMVYSDKGYYLDYSEKNKEAVMWDIMEVTRGFLNVDYDTIYDIIDLFAESDLINKEFFEKGIITSKRIQSTYYKCTTERKNVSVNKDIWVLTVEEMLKMSARSSILNYFEDEVKEYLHIEDECKNDCIENECKNDCIENECENDCIKDDYEAIGNELSNESDDNNKQNSIVRTSNDNHTNIARTSNDNHTKSSQSKIKENKIKKIKTKDKTAVAAEKTTAKTAAAVISDCETESGIFDKPRPAETAVDYTQSKTDTAYTQAIPDTQDKVDFAYTQAITNTQGKVDFAYTQAITDTQNKTDLANTSTEKSIDITATGTAVNNIVLDVYEKNIGEPSAFVKQNIEECRKYFSDDVIIFAIKQACEAGVQKWSYIRAILKRFHTQGITTVEQAKQKNKFEHTRQSKNIFVPKETSFNCYEQRDYDEEELEKIALRKRGII